MENKIHKIPAFLSGKSNGIILSIVAQAAGEEKRMNLAFPLAGEKIYCYNNLITHSLYSNTVQMRKGLKG